jgi:hypothetical protein
MGNETRQPDTDVSYTAFSTDGTYFPREGGGIQAGVGRATKARTAALVDRCYRFAFSPSHCSGRQPVE